MTIRWKAATAAAGALMLCGATALAQGSTSDVFNSQDCDPAQPGTGVSGSQAECTPQQPMNGTQSQLQNTPQQYSTTPPAPQQPAYNAQPAPQQPAYNAQPAPQSGYGQSGAQEALTNGQQQDQQFTQQRAENSPIQNDMASKVTVAAGAGLADFTGSLGDHTNAGPSWNVRGGYEMNPNIGIEVGYLGARNGIDDTRLPQAHSITTTGLSGDLKLTAPIATSSGVLIKPYLFGGVGGAYYGVSGDNSLYSSDSDLMIPLGLGGDAFFNPNVSVGARLGYDVNVANRIGNDSAGNLLNLTANVGVHY